MREAATPARRGKNPFFEIPILLAREPEDEKESWAASQRVVPVSRWFSRIGSVALGALIAMFVTGTWSTGDGAVIAGVILIEVVCVVAAGNHFATRSRRDALARAIAKRPWYAWAAFPAYVGGT